MFISKRLYDETIGAKEDEIRELREKINKQEESQKDLREEIENEHLENYKNHRKLLEIEKVLQEQDYNSVKNLKNKIRTILNKSYLTHMEAIR